MLGNGRKTFHHSLSLLRGMFLRIWELRKAKLYDNPNVQQSPSQSTSGVLPGVTMGLGKCEGLYGKAGASINCISLSSSAHCSGCVVNGLGAMAAVRVIYLFFPSI